MKRAQREDLLKAKGHSGGLGLEFKKGNVMIDSDDPHVVRLSLRAAEVVADCEHLVNSSSDPNALSHGLRGTCHTLEHGVTRVFVCESGIEDSKVLPANLFAVYTYLKLYSKSCFYEHLYQMTLTVYFKSMRQEAHT